ncbi:MAG: DUF1684 domain-containing protein [Chitinophagaceae bacterium]
MKSMILFFCLCFCIHGFSQKGYRDSLETFQKNYVASHEVVTDSSKKNLKFFSINPAYRINAEVEEVRNSPWFSVETSGSQRQTFRVYAIAKFKINGKALQLSLLQSQGLGTEYKDYLFLPFTDATNGEETYTNGRYIDLSISDIQNGHITLDFNKAYNPYCAYVSGKYNCPIPPASNRLEIPVPAGEMVFEKH